MALKEISIEIIRKCPNNCIHCSSEASMNCNEFIPYSKFCEVIDGAKELGLTTICFSGGEPLLHPDFVKMVEYSFDNKLDCYIYTSGIYLYENDFAGSIPISILSAIKGKISKLIFNVEAASETIYDYIMGTHGNFKYLKESIQNANKLGIRTEAHFVPMKANLLQIDEVVKMCSKLNISRISFLRLVNHGRAEYNQHKIILSNHETQELKERLNKLKNEQSSIDIRIGVPLSGYEYKHNCMAANEKLNIKYDGYVYPCEVFKNNRVKSINQYQPDNIFEKNIIDIYQRSQYLHEVRKCIKQFSESHDCENCMGQYYIELGGFNNDMQGF